MATEGGNPDTGIGLHEATLAIGKLLGPETDNQDETEALSQEEGDEPETDEGYEAENVEADETDEVEYDETDEVEDPDLEDEVTEDEAPTQELADDLTVKVKVDGQEMEVSLAELRNGYSRTADYTRKATDLANQRKAFNAEVEAIRQERAQYEQLLPALQQQLQQAAIAEPDWDSLYDEDPIEAARLERHWRKSREEQTQKLAAIEAEQRRLNEAKAKDYQQALVEFVEAERGKLPNVIPEWKDQSVMAREAQELREWAVAQGLTEQDIDGLTQAAHIAVIRKAMLYDKGAKKVETAKQTPSKNTRKVVKPGSRGTQVKPGSVDVKRASQRLARTGRVSDAAALLDKLL